jgi:hypothetical protein
MFVTDEAWKAGSETRRDYYFGMKHVRSTYSHLRTVGSKLRLVELMSQPITPRPPKGRHGMLHSNKVAVRLIGKRVDQISISVAHE